MGHPRAVTRTQLLASGRSPFEVKRDLRAGELVPLAHGVYLPRADYDALDDVGVHRVWARHVGSTLGPAAAISHVSAAILHGAPAWNVPLDRVHVSRPHGWRLTKSLHAHAARWSDGDIVTVDGVPVTSPARTVADVARSQPRAQAVAIGDALLRIEPAARSLLGQALESTAGLTGAARARSVAGFVDGRSESVGESLSRVRMAEYGLPRPDLQRELVARGGRRYRADFFWEEFGIVGEFDGAGKYHDRRDLVAEKFREDALRDLGLEVIRWNWAELDHFDVVVRRFDRAVDRSRRLAVPQSSARW
ncbi:MAG: hypothetical protein GXY65_03485 [Rhodococcus sp.]|uniref:endonuclease domain-containing protein n=1 Tax=Rhodococcus TaxID=1827 RepID=UPI001694BFEE|nr:MULTISPECIES: endonuclease domain-containing protein [Rhodococcus]NLV78401.1 hypothetical protein [Rhodococcus sp. (in: high G+C Gram-positive bacteria)]